MTKLTKITNLICLLLLITHIAYADGVLTELRALGYAMHPAPQQLSLTKQHITLDASWKIVLENEGGIKALQSLQSRARELHGLAFEGTGKGQIVLKMSPALVKEIDDPAIAEQAYKITIVPGKVTVEGAAETGLFYGVQSLLQLIKAKDGANFQLPEGTITDWPDLELRFIHWDTKHHQERLKTLKRYIDWAASFKINAIAFELEDKYEYPSHPIIGAPDAFTKAEMQDLTAYALDRYIQLVPNVQAPAHMTFVLKHEEFAHLRADESNYQICMCDEASMELIFDMYQDMIDATPGVEYFFVSTDEVYYAGICGKCAQEYNDTNRSQLWVDYVNRVHTWMSNRGRKVMAWVEYPLLTEDILQLPEGLIDGITGTYRSEEWIQNEKERGIQQLAYSSIQGAEYLFPNYFPTQYRGKAIPGRLNEVYQNVVKVEEKGADLKGTFAAAWDDAGLHSETFWLGWATVSQYGWTKNSPNLQQNIADFMDVFYGADSPEMTEVYKMLEEQARFYEDLWDKVPSQERDRGYGNSHGKGIGGERYDLQLSLPDLPAVQDLSVQANFRSKYEDKIIKASSLIQENDQLIYQLMHRIPRVQQNSYNLEVFLSIAYLERFTIQTVVNLAKIEDYLLEASQTGDDYAEGVSLMVEAHKLSEEILAEKDAMWSDFTASWEKSRLPKNQNVNGKEFKHVMDDVKDHFADRRRGLEYMLAPFERMKLEAWQNELAQIINDFAKAHDVPVSGVKIKRLED